ncbi:MAG TPA: hypothetical protein DEQ14_00250 [Treponema sp.]|nr:hypothetical protein [Treponema sp.]
MKKILFAHIAFLMTLNLHAGDIQTDMVYNLRKPADITPYAWEIEELPEEPEEKTPFRMKNRTFEFGFTGGANMANDFTTGKDILQETWVIDINKLSNGFKLGFGLNITPFFFNVNIRDQWGFGLDVARIEGFGNTDISGKLLNLKQADEEKFGAGAAIFADIGIPVFFHVKKLKVKVRPGIFVPLAYTEPDFSYTFKEYTDENGKKGTFIGLDYNMRIYTSVFLEFENLSSIDIGQTLNSFNMDAIGFDLSAEVEYPLFSWLDLGANIKNIPITPSKPDYSIELKDRVYADTGKIDFGELINGGDFPDDVVYTPENFTPVYGPGRKFIHRPFKMVFFANYHPFKTRILSLIPSLGFAVNSLYVSPGSIEGGLKIRFDFANIFVPTIGVNYEDRVWKNSVDFILNLRAFGIGIGVSSQSQDFVKSWQLGGLSANVAVQFGW